MKKTKRLIPLLLAALMCFSLIVPVSAEADEGELNYLLSAESWASVPNTSTDATTGAKVNDNFRSTVSGSQTKVDEDGNLYLHNPVTAKGGFDIQIKSTELVSVSQDFTFSMRFKMIGTWDKDKGEFIIFYNNSNSSNEQIKAFSLVENALQLASDTTKVSGSLSTEEFNTVEFMFHYDEDTGFYTSIDCYINGCYWESVTITSKAPKKIDMIRMTNWKANTGLIIDSYYIVAGHHTLYTPDSDTVSVKGYQTTEKNAETNTFDLRLVGLLHDEAYAKYDKVGFAVEVTYGSTTKSTTKDITTIYSSITAGETAGYAEYTAESLGGEYIYVLNCVNIPTNLGNITFTVTPYYQYDEGGVVFTGVTKTFTVNPEDLPDSDLPETEPAN